MKKILIISLLIPTLVFGKCDFSKGISKNTDGSYTYTKECHVAVGELNKEIGILKEIEENRKQQVERLSKSLELKDLALEKSDERMNNWRAEAYKQNDAMLSVYNKSKYSDYIVFGLGVVTAILSGYTYSKLAK